VRLADVVVIARQGANAAAKDGNGQDAKRLL
jgi:hypothetical protein